MSVVTVYNADSAAVEGDARHRAHLPDFGAPAVPSALLDRLRQPKMRTNGENAAPRKWVKTSKKFVDKSVDVRNPTSSGDFDQAVHHVQIRPANLS